MNVCQFRILLILVALPCNWLFASPPESPLFANNDVLELGISVDFDTLCRPREDPDCDYTPSVLSYSEAGDQKSIPIRIKVRGGWRSLSRNCQVPLLFILFDPEDTEGTLFEGQKSLPLTTHCGRAGLMDDFKSSRTYLNYEQYLLKEYLAYRIFNQVSDLSLKVKLARVLYEKPEKPGKGSLYYAFFTEHFESLAKRKDLTLLERESFDENKLDFHQADLMALFEFMIGNTDWSIARQRNIILLQGEEGVQFPVPYDLDMSGLVNAPYSGPPPSLPIDEVTERYYLGYCHPGIEWAPLFGELLSLQGDIEAEVPTVPGLYKRERSSAKRYIEQFYKLLNSPTKRTKFIKEACQPWPPTPEDHMAPQNLGR